MRFVPAWSIERSSVWPWLETSVVLLGFVLAACQGGANVTAQQTLPEGLRVPEQVRRLVVLTNPSREGAERQAYQRLEAEAFGLKAARPRLTIVDRQHLPALVRELEVQLGGLIAEETAVRVGRLLAADAVLLYQVETPGLRDVVLARFGGDIPPVVVRTQVILIETAEVVYHNVVTSTVGGEAADGRGAVRASLERAIARTTEDLRRAFR